MTGRDQHSSTRHPAPSHPGPPYSPPLSHTTNAAAQCTPDCRTNATPPDQPEPPRRKPRSSADAHTEADPRPKADHTPDRAEPVATPGTQSQNQPLTGSVTASGYTHHCVAYFRYTESQNPRPYIFDIFYTRILQKSRDGGVGRQVTACGKPAAGRRSRSGRARYWPRPDPAQCATERIAA
jgi:hypothetical protein